MKISTLAQIRQIGTKNANLQKFSPGRNGNMVIQDWSDKIILADLTDDPEFTDEINALTEQMEKKPKDVVLNFTGVKYLNSSNISKLLKLRKVLADRDYRLCLCGIAIQVWGVFLLTGLDALFDVAENTASALASLQMD